MKYKTESQEGFTIVELMIATTVLSTILVMVTLIMISIGQLYYKGVSQAQVQDSVRSITDEIAQQLQLSDQGPVTASAVVNGNNVSAYCIGGNRYSYVLNRQITNQIAHVLWRDKTPPGGCATAMVDMGNNSLTNGTELIPPLSRLTAFSIAPTISPYNVSVGIAYGDDDLLNLAGLNTTCHGNTGDQFCATATLTTTVVQRLQGG